jgi:hypothetical protein
LNGVLLLYDQPRYKEEVSLFADKLKISRMMSLNSRFEDEPADYDLLLILINPDMTGNKNFIFSAAEAAGVRKNTGTIIFVINDSDRLTQDEISSCRLELEKSLIGIIENPIILALSTFHASIYHSYINGIRSLKDIRKIHSLSIQTDEGFIISGKDLKEEDILSLYNSSGLEELIRIIQEYLNNPVHIHGGKYNWLVTGKNGVGKSSFINLFYSLKDQICLTESEDFNKRRDRFYDGVFVILDPDLQCSAGMIEAYCSESAGINTIFVINRIDEYMLYCLDRGHIIEKITLQIREYSNSPIISISSLFIQVLSDYKAGKITLNDLILNPDIVLTDDLGILLINEFTTKEKFLELFSRQSGQDEFHAIIEKIIKDKKVLESN